MNQSVAYTLDLTGRMITRLASGTGTGAENTSTVYGYIGSGDSADLQLGAGNVIGERYLSLPGGVLLTRRYTTSGGDVWSIPNLHGDIVATTGPTGTLTGSGFVYDPFGQPVNTTSGVTAPNVAPDTRTNGLTDAWEGQHQRGDAGVGAISRWSAEWSTRGNANSGFKVGTRLVRNVFRFRTGWR